MKASPQIIEWHGLTLERQKNGSYRHDAVVGFRIIATLWEEDWQARVGMGRCYNPQKTPQEALDDALEDHEGKREEHMATARRLTEFANILFDAAQLQLGSQLKGYGFSV